MAPHELKWDDVKILQACLVHPTLSAAARALSMQQSTVSRRIQALEDALGTDLFVRTSTGVHPTALALELSSHAMAMGEHMLALERLAMGHEPSARGRVRVALIEPVALYMLMPLMDDFRAVHPDVSLELVTGYDFADLTRLEADIALRFARPRSGEFIVKRLFTMPLCVLASQRYLDQYGPPSLEHGRWVNVTLPQMKTPEALWYDAHVEVEPWLQTNSYVVATEAILSGQCVGLTTTAVRQMSGHLSCVIDTGVALPEPLELWLVTHASLRHVPRVDAVWSWLEQCFASAYLDGVMV